MRILKTTIVAAVLTLTSTSAFAGTQATATPQSDTARQVHVVKAPVLMKAGYYAPKTVTRKVTRVVVEPVETLVARDASTADHSPFVFKTGKKVNTKTFRPVAAKSADMPNLFK